MVTTITHALTTEETPQPTCLADEVITRLGVMPVSQETVAKHKNLQLALARRSHGWIGRMGWWMYVYRLFAAPLNALFTPIEKIGITLDTITAVYLLLSLGPAILSLVGYISPIFALPFLWLAVTSFCGAFLIWLGERGAFPEWRRVSYGSFWRERIAPIPAQIDLLAKKATQTIRNTEVFVEYIESDPILVLRDEETGEEAVLAIWEGQEIIWGETIE